MRLDDYLIGVAKRIKELERRDRAAKRTGKIVEVDAAKGLARVELMAKGWKGEPFLSPWVPWAEQAAGAARTHFPPSVGQQVEITSETGDLADGVISMSVPSNENSRPSQAGDEFVLIDAGGVRLSVQGGKVTLTCELFEVNGETVQINGSSLRHNAKNVGDTHLHGGITPGDDNTDVPSN